MRRGLLLAPVIGAAVILGNRLRKRRPAYSFEDKVVLITGGSRGLGLVLARMLAAEGAKLAILARDELELLRARKQIRELGGAVEPGRPDSRRGFTRSSRG